MKIHPMDVRIIKPENNTVAHRYNFNPNKKITNTATLHPQHTYKSYIHVHLFFILFYTSAYVYGVTSLKAFFSPLSQFELRNVEFSLTVVTRTLLRLWWCNGSSTADKPR